MPREKTARGNKVFINTPRIYKQITKIAETFPFYYVTKRGYAVIKASARVYKEPLKQKQGVA